MNYSVTVKETLLSLIEEMDSQHWLFTRNPNADFTRKKKWTFDQVMRFILTMEGKSLKDELLEFFDFSNDTPSNSSFNQRRSQILPEAFEFLFHEFTEHYYGTDPLYNGYRLLACDGSDVCIAYNPEDVLTYRPGKTGGRGFNCLHLTALYDLNGRKYLNAVLQPGNQENEYRAMCDLIDVYKGMKNTIFIADRGFESYNIFAHVEQNDFFYLIRAKDILSNGIVSSVKDQLPEQEDIFDKDVTVILTRKQTNVVKENPAKYRIMMKSQPFDYLDLHTNRFYEMNMRIVRFPISENSYECIITNLPRESFPAEAIKALYHMRWGIETSFRELKYAIGLTSFHSKKIEYIKQEIWARIILYNFCEIITTNVAISKKEKNTKHTYQLNYTRAIRICCYFMSLKKEKAPPDVEFLISKELLPVRTGRSDPRKVKPQSAVSFLYRVA